MSMYEFADFGEAFFSIINTLTEQAGLMTRDPDVCSDYDYDYEDAGVGVSIYHPENTTVRLYTIWEDWCSWEACSVQNLYRRLVYVMQQVQENVVRLVNYNYTITSFPEEYTDLVALGLQNRLLQYYPNLQRMKAQAG